MTTMTVDRRAHGRVTGAGATRRAPALFALLVAMALVAAACGGDDGGTTAASTEAPATAAAPQDFSVPGPYPVGTTVLDLGDRQVYAFYPADPDRLGEGQPTDGYSSAIAFPESLRAAVPAELIQDIPLDAHTDAPSSPDGPFPVVVHSHGFGGYAAYASQHFQHLASWGFVVASPEHIERDLAATALDQVVRGADVEVLDRTLALLEEQDAAGPLAGTMDLERLAAEGHSAGGSAVFRWGQDPAVTTIIGQAPGAPVDVPEGAADRTAALEAAYEATPPPDKPTMILAGEVDLTIPLAGVEREFEWLAPPKRLAVLATAGHNAFTDLCAPIRAQGGLMQYAGRIPAPERLLQLGEDGCVEGNLDPQLGYDVIDHLTVAQLRDVFGIDAEVAAASLERSYLDERFPGTLARYAYEP